jgi:5-methyltetrahydrofolate--homocysteine methyltransferase
MEDRMADLKALAEAILKGDRDKAREITQQAIDEKIPPQDIISNGLIAGMGVVGVKFKANEFYVPEVLIAARAMHASMDLLKPLIAESGIEPVGRALIGTVKGDLHDIGKNLVAMMLEGAGFEVVDLGVDVKNDQFIQAVKDRGSKVLCLSALLTTTMPAMKEVIESLKAAGIRDGIKIMVGGAPVTQAYAEEIGADGYAADAASAVDKAKELLAA